MSAYANYWNDLESNGTACLVGPFGHTWHQPLFTRILKSLVEAEGGVPALILKFLVGNRLRRRWKGLSQPWVAVHVSRRTNANAKTNGRRDVRKESRMRTIPTNTTLVNVLPPIETGVRSLFFLIIFPGGTGRGMLGMECGPPSGDAWRRGDHAGRGMRCRSGPDRKQSAGDGIGPYATKMEERNG